MRAHGLMIAAVALAMAAGCETTTEPVPDRDYFPLEVGHQWTYTPEDPVFGAPLDWTVTERRGDTVTLVRPAGGSHSGSVALVDGAREVRLLRDGDQVAPFYRFLPGAQWVHRDPWECDDGASYTAVVEPDPVVTPAGTFRDVLRVERRTEATCTDAGTMVEWWAPGVGLVRWEELNFWAGRPIRYDLVSYTVD